MTARPVFCSVAVALVVMCSQAWPLPSLAANGVCTICVGLVILNALRRQQCLRAAYRCCRSGLSRPRRSPRWLFQAARRAWACWRELGTQSPRVVMALGGYAALLPGLLAPLHRRPVVVLEQNAHAERTNRLLAKRARSRCPVHCGDACPAAQSLSPVGQPGAAVRPQARGGAERLRVLVMGGSLARTLNDLILAAAPRLATHAGIDVIHLAGEADRERVAAAYAEAGLAAEVLGFVDDMAAIYDRVDLTVSRAGATSVAECCNAGLGAIYIPLPWAAEDHQTANARLRLQVVDGAAQHAVTGDGLARVLMRLADHRHEVAQLGQRAAGLARPRAAADVVELLGRVVRRQSSRMMASDIPPPAPPDIRPSTAVDVAFLTEGHGRRVIYSALAVLV